MADVRDPFEFRSKSEELEQLCKLLQGRANHLSLEAVKWVPVDRTLTGENQMAVHEKQQMLLQQAALDAGGAILRLAVLRLLETLPQLQTRAFQARADLRRHVDAGKLPWLWEVPRAGFDALVIQFFDECCAIWFRSTPNYYWRYGGEAKRARLYSQFLIELATHLRSLPPDPRRPEEQDTTGYVRDHNALRVLWEQFVSDGNQAQLIRFVREHPGVTTTSGHEYPYLHRICDVMPEGQSYRLLRYAHWTQYLILKPIPREIVFPQRPGVPYWLQGEQLRRWVQNVKSGEVPETDNPAYWGRYK